MSCDLTLPTLHSGFPSTTTPWLLLLPSPPQGFPGPLKLRPLLFPRGRADSYLVGMEGAEPAFNMRGIPARDQATVLEGTQLCRCIRASCDHLMKGILKGHWVIVGSLVLQAREEDECITGRTEASWWPRLMSCFCLTALDQRVINPRVPGSTSLQARKYNTPTSQMLLIGIVSEIPATPGTC